MINTWAVFKRELRGYFATPVAYVFIVIFLLFIGIFTFYMGDFFGGEQADLQQFFFWHPILYMIFIPAISMRLWAEERRSGTIEMLMTLPVSMGGAVLGKFLAAWAFTGIALVGTFPIWITVNYLGDPDNGVIVASYVGSLLMAGGYLAVGSCISALTKNQVVAFVLSAMACLLLTLAGYPFVRDAISGWLPTGVVDAIASLSFWTHFDAIKRGVLDARDMLFFLTFMVVWLFANAVAIEHSKSN